MTRQDCRNLEFHQTVREVLVLWSR